MKPASRFRSAVLAAMWLSAPVLARRPLPDDDGGAHAYVLGRAALADQQLGNAARDFDAARRQAPGNATLTRRTFDVALTAGDRALAVAMAAALAGQPDDTGLAAIVRALAALDRHDWRGYDAARASLKDAGDREIVAPVMDAWGRLARGDAMADSTLPSAAATAAARPYFAESGAALMAAAHRWAAAAAAYTTLSAADPDAVRLRRAAGACWQAAGQTARAVTVLGGGEADDPLLVQARARLIAGKPVGGVPLTPAAGLAQLFTRIAVDLARERAAGGAIAFARLSTFADPAGAEGWLVTGALLARDRQLTPALIAYSQVPADEAWAGQARAESAAVLFDLGRKAEGLALLQAAAGPAASGDAVIRLATYQMRLGDTRAAAATYARVLDGRRAAGLAPDGALTFLRGSALEQAGDFTAAEPELRQAMALRPNDPVVLNYLGYALLDRGQRLDEARAMIERAAALQPGNAAITDSLGWAYYRLGRTGDAVATLERAVASEPADPTITGHLGDAYWVSGRRVEARYQWRAALDLAADDKARTDLRARLEYGLADARAR